MAIAQKSSLSSVASDPLRDFKFAVNIQQNGSTDVASVNLGFMTVSGLGMAVDVIAYRGGGMNVSVQNMPGQIAFNPCVFTRGVTLDANPIQINWMQQLYSFAQGTGTGITPTSDFRSTISVYVLDHPSTGSTVEQAGFKLYNAWPYTLAYSDLDAGSNQLFITQMTFAYEGFDAKLGAPGGAGI